MPIVKVNDININYEIHGQGEPLIFICGFGQPLEWFYHILPSFEENLRCVLFDNRGTGKTDAPDISYSPEMMADDVAGLMDAIGLTKSHILGHSMGGCIAQQFAIRYPDRVSKLILLSTWCGGPHTVPLTTPEAQDADVMIVQQFTKTFIEANPDIIADFKDKFLKPPDSLTGLIRLGEMLSHHDAYARLPGIKAPTLVITGDVDQIVPPKNSEILASRIPNARLVVFPDTAHDLFEAGEELDQEVINFLKSKPTNVVD